MSILGEKKKILEIKKTTLYFWKFVFHLCYLCFGTDDERIIIVLDSHLRVATQTADLYILPPCGLQAEIILSMDLA